MKTCVYLLLVLGTCICFIGCKKRQPTEKGTYFEWGKITLKNINLPISKSNGWIFPEEITDSTNLEKYGILIHFDYRLLDNVKQDVSLHSNSHPIQVYVLKDKIESIKIYTVHMFDNIYPAGSDITHCFQERHGNALKIIGYNLDKFSGLNGEWDNKMKAIDYYVYLRELPLHGKIMQFKVVITFSSGKTMESTTKEISITS